MQYFICYGNFTITDEMKFEINELLTYTILLYKYSMRVKLVLFSNITTNVLKIICSMETYLQLWFLV